jgi:hypothetical protein
MFGVLRASQSLICNVHSICICTARQENDNDRVSLSPMTCLASSRAPNVVGIIVSMPNEVLHVDSTRLSLSPRIDVLPCACTLPLVPFINQQSSIQCTDKKDKCSSSSRRMFHAAPVTPLHLTLPLTQAPLLGII